MAVTPFGEWTPDQPDFAKNGLVVAKNCVPKTGGIYGPLGELDTFSSALTDRCQGAFAARDKDGGVANFAGDASKLYLLGDATFSDVSRSGGYATTAEESWRFCQFGQVVCATNFANDVQAYTLGTSSNFDALSAGAPRARHIAVIDPGFLMVGNTFDPVDGGVPNRVWWGAFQNPGDWPTIGSADAEAKQSDFNDMPSGGWVQAIIGAVGGASGAVFMDSAVYRMDYEGPPTVFRFTEVERARGTPAPNSVVNIGPFAAYLGEDGFYLFDGAQSRPIGSGKLDKTFFAELNQSYYGRIYGASDPINKLIFWAYPSTSSQTGNPDKCVIYNWETGWWTIAEFDCELIFKALSTSYTLEGLDDLGYTLDTLPFSLDSRVWTGGRPVLSGFDSEHNLGYFSGSNLEATFETGEFPQSERIMYVDGIRPMIDGGTPQVSVGYRSSPSGSVSYTTATTAGDDGVCPQRIAARFVRAKVVIPAASSWSNAIGIEPRIRQAGMR